MTRYQPDEIRRIAADQRMLVWLLLAFFATEILVAYAQNESRVLVKPAGIVALLVTICLLFRVRKSALHVGLPVPILWSIGMFFPYINLVVLLIISFVCSRALKARGISVGLMGAKGADVERALVMVLRRDTDPLSSPDSVSGPIDRNTTYQK